MVRFVLGLSPVVGSSPPTRRTLQPGRSGAELLIGPEKEMEGMLQPRSKTLVIERPEQLMKVSTRRDFLKVLGIGGAIVLMPAVFAACDDDSTQSDRRHARVTLNLSNDIGILNYAYALEQLEAAFYTQVVASVGVRGYTAEQQEVLADIRNHEVIHREFFKAALGTQRDSGAEPERDRRRVDDDEHRDRASKNAEMFEDLGVSAYNGAGKYLTSADYLTIAGKIVSVEARHAAAIRDMRDALGAIVARRRRARGSPAARRGRYRLVSTSSSSRVGVLTRVARRESSPTRHHDRHATPTQGRRPTDAGPPSPTP